MTKLPKFTRTAKAATADRMTKWDLIEAIALDAVDAGVPISGAESVMAAKAALDRAGDELSAKTVQGLCVVAKFDHESTPGQRTIWRRYGWTIVQEPVRYGWSQEATANLLTSAPRLTFREVRSAVTSVQQRGDRPRDIERDLERWVNQLNTVLIDGARLVTVAENAPVLSAQAQMAVAIYRNIAERELDREIRRLLDSEPTKP